MHLYGDVLERYMTRKLPASQLTRLDAHVSNCLFCAHGLADGAVASTSWERRGWLGRLVRVEGQTALDADDEELDAQAA
jgi:hypothetical protein